MTNFEKWKSGLTVQDAADSFCPEKCPVRDKCENWDGNGDDACAVLLGAWANAEAPSDLTVGEFTDPRDGQIYRTVKMPDGKVWLAQNLNYATEEGSWCYDNDESNGVKYGRLYSWSEAKAACPDGWHLPSNEEWNKLDKAVGAIDAGKKLKAKDGWNDRKDGTSGNGTDEFGFSALPGGFRRYSDGSFDNVGNVGDWWSATEDGNGYACGRGMGYNHDGVDEHSLNESYGGSVRCVKDGGDK